MAAVSRALKSGLARDCFRRRASHLLRTHAATSLVEALAKLDDLVNGAMMFG